MLAPMSSSMFRCFKKIPKDRGIDDLVLMFDDGGEIVLPPYLRVENIGNPPGQPIKILLGPGPERHVDDIFVAHHGMNYATIAAGLKRLELRNQTNCTIGDGFSYVAGTKEQNARRLAIMHVPQEFVFFHLFAQPLDGKAKILTPTLYYRGAKVRWQDCEIIDVEVIWETGTFAFKLRSMEFAPVRPGDCIERVDFAIDERMIDVVSGRKPQTKEQWEHERSAVVSALRALCDGHGDNHWPDGCHLGDVIVQHLAVYMDSDEDVEIDEDFGDPCEGPVTVDLLDSEEKLPKHGILCKMPADFLTVDYTYCKVDHTTGEPIGDTVVCEACRSRYAPADYPIGCPNCIHRTPSLKGKLSGLDGHWLLFDEGLKRVKLPWFIDAEYVDGAVRLSLKPREIPSVHSGEEYVDLPPLVKCGVVAAFGTEYSAIKAALDRLALAHDRADKPLIIHPRATRS